MPSTAACAVNSEVAVVVVAVIVDVVVILGGLLALEQVFLKIL